MSQSEIGKMPKVAIDVVVSNCEGLHARPVMKFVDVANQFCANIIVYKEDEAVDGKSVMHMMTLGAGQGTLLKIEADGDDAPAALESLKKLFEDKFGEE